MSAEIDYGKAEDVAGLVEERFRQLIEEGAFADLEPYLASLGKTGSEDQAVTLTLQLKLSDSEREREVVVTEASRAYLNDGEVYDFCQSDAVVRYLCDNEIRVFQSNACPHCWGDWPDKHTNTTCPECGYEFGKQVKLLIDDDICPFCFEGKVSRQELRCNACGEQVDERFVSWG
ncbi:MAG: hypothetical protein JNJ69_13555 [Leptospiraceae bacterium]|nr:hypothetical protein [Leptospiraceae bacterium]